MSSYFKIVQTTENGLTKLTVVPSGWENSGVLYWPTTSKTGNIADAMSKPDSTWKKFPCQLKRTGYVTYEQANEEIDAMAGRSDTDDAVTVNPKRRRMVKRQNVFVDNFQNLMDSNNATCQTITSAQKKETVFCQPSPTSSPQIVILENRKIISPRLTSQDPSTIQGNASVFNTSTDPFLNDVISFEPEQLGMQSADFSVPNEDPGLNEKILCFMEKLETKLDETREREEKIFRCLARIEAKIDALAQGSQERTIITMQADILNPVKTIEDAVSLEEALKDEIYFQNIVNQMKIKLSKNLRSFNCCYSLVDLFFDRLFFNLCSWSGQSRSKSMDKYAFKSFRRILNCFFQCVRTIDGDFTYGECESFFKDRTLKHSSQRAKANSGRLSKIKHRPTGIPSRKCRESDYSTPIQTHSNYNGKEYESQENEADIDSENKENEGDTHNNCRSFSQSGEEIYHTDDSNSN